MTPVPTLVVVSGPPGAGKTTLAHKIARAVGCPAICRDEIKEGMVHAALGFVPGPGDELTMRTLPVFFDALELLLRAGVTTVAEAAFQDRYAPAYRAFDRVSVEAPSIEVDTTDGYTPGLPEIVAFVNG